MVFHFGTGTTMVFFAWCSISWLGQSLSAWVGVVCFSLLGLVIVASLGLSIGCLFF